MSKIGNYRISTHNLASELSNLKDLEVKKDEVTRRIDTRDFEEIKKTMGDAEMLNQTLQTSELKSPTFFK